MPRYILKIPDTKMKTEWYMEWSTVVDAPVTYGMSLDEFKSYYEKEYGRKGMLDLPQRIERVEKYGSSCHFDTDGIAHYFNYNRAGDKETKLSKKEILTKYCHNRPES